MVLIIGVAGVGVSTGRGLWEWAVYSDCRPDTALVTNEIPIQTAHGTTEIQYYYYKVKRKRWSWFPASDELLIAISEHRYEEILKERNRPAKGGQ